MNALNPAPTPPDFDKIVWKCPVCNQQRTDKYIKVHHHDVGVLFGHETGVMSLHVKYCADMPLCQEKAFNRGWVIEHFFPKQCAEMNAK